ncbi:MAG: histidine phosphatase family protein [Deferribacteraceae bacterium]|jgi:broad specificity phosphatase PhoE|nr:histidine phosphatase family protein [Deferribacteraceae bacterium]
MSKVFGDRFYFARHGETENNVQGIVTGVKDVPLNDTGRMQASKANPYILALDIKSCICSPLIRAVGTAMLMLEGTGIKPVFVNGIGERSWGKLECTAKSELDKFIFNKMGVEPWDEFVLRNIEAVNPLDMETPVLVVAHSGTFRAFCEYLSIKIEKKPVINAWPYCFLKTDQIWNVTEICP